MNKKYVKVKINQILGPKYNRNIPIITTRSVGSFKTDDILPTAYNMVINIELNPNKFYEVLEHNAYDNTCYIIPENSENPYWVPEKYLIDATKIKYDQDFAQKVEEQF